MKQSDLFLQGEGDAWHERNKDKPRLPDPVIEAMQACNLQPRTIAEFGCGTGWRLEEITKIWTKARTVGYDASADAINAKPRGRSHLFHADILTALRYMGENVFDTIIFGFCLYLVDREDLMMIAAHTDRVLQDKGHIIIHDFVDGPCRVPYKHKEGVYSYHDDYSKLWLANPVYGCVHVGDVDADCAMVNILQKDIAAGWPERVK